MNPAVPNDPTLFRQLKPRQPLPLAFCIALAAGLFSGMALGFDFNSDAPVTIKSDQATLDDILGKAVYTGTVIVTQEASTLNADKVVVFRDAEGLSKIEAYGDLAHYVQTATPENPATDAKAKVITFIKKQNLLILKGQGVIVQNSNVFRGELIRYDTVKRVVTAEGDKTQNGTNGNRVEMVILPKKTAPGNGEPNGEKPNNEPAE